MVEIAIALGVIGFALVAIIGILPAGLNVQRDNRSETIINQDATLWLEAIRSGAQGIEELPNYVRHISIVTTNPLNGTVVSNILRRADNDYTTGREIIGLLTVGAVIPHTHVQALVTSFSGSAAEKDPDPSRQELSFAYLLRVVIERQEQPLIQNGGAIPFAALAGPIPDEERLASLYETRLTFSYPYVRESQSPSRSQSFRAALNRSVATNLISGREYYFFAP